MKDALEINEYLKSIDPKQGKGRVRLLALLSAAVAKCNPQMTKIVIRHLKTARIDSVATYETIIQSYLFLGFPRMIEAAFVFHEVYAAKRINKRLISPSSTTVRKWFADGLRLCHKVYGKNYDALKDKLMAIGPEILEWMILEGYGKVLSRPGLSRIERELAEVAALIVDGRERQLVSHILGSLNVGADLTLIRQVSRDISIISGQKAYRMADKVISRIEKKYAAAK